MKKIVILISALLVLPAAVHASHWQTENGTSSRFEVTVGGGYTALGYQFDNNLLPATMSVKNTGSWTVKGHIGYQFFFLKWMGIGVGANFQRYGGAAQLDGNMVWNKVTDTDGEMYNHTLSLNKWKQKDQIWMVEIPVSLCFAIPLNNVFLTLEAGGMYGIPVIHNYKGDGTTQHTGYYEPWHLPLHDQPDHGFYTEKGFHPDGDIKTKSGFAIFGKIGVAIPMTDHLQLLVQAYGHYYLSSIVTTSDGNTFGFRNDRASMQDAHYFMEDYSSLSTTGLIKKDPKPWNVGVEVGIRLVFPHRSRHCNCNWWDSGQNVTWAK